MTLPLFLGQPTTIADAPSRDEGGGVVALSNGTLLSYWAEYELWQQGAKFLGFHIRLTDTVNGTTGDVITLNVMGQQGPDAVPLVTALANGGFVVSWLGSFGPAGRDVFFRIFNAAGAPQGPTTQIDPRDQGQGSAGVAPHITALDTGGFVAAWDQFHSGSWESFGRTYDAAGQALGPVIQLNVSTLGDQGAPHVTALAGGRFIAVWHDVYGINAGVDDRALVARIYGVDGTALSKTFVVNQDSGAGHDAAQSVSVTELAGGLVAMTWQHSYDIGDFSGPTTVVARVFTAAGKPVGAQFVVAQGDLVSTSATNPVITALLDGRFMVAWTEYAFDLENGGGASRVMARVVDADGGFSSAAFSVAPQDAFGPSNPTITTLIDGRVVVGYHQTGGGTWGNDLIQRILDPRQAAINLTGTERGDLVLGTRFDDTVAGGAGRDVLSGGAGHDRLSGQAGVDVVRGGAGDDALNGGGANDVLTGGAGRDVFIFAATSGDDRIEDFTLGADRLNLRSFGFADAATALAHFSQTDGGASFAFGGASVVLAGVDLTLIGGSALML